MSLTGVVGSFATGIYVVSRYTALTYDTNGRLTAFGTPTEFNLRACVQPVTGDELEFLPEGERTNEARVIYSDVELRTRQSGQEPDSIEIDGLEWVIVKVERWQAFGQTHWRAYATRLETP